LNATAIAGFLKYPGLVVEKKTDFGQEKIAKKTGIGFGKTRAGNTSRRGHRGGMQGMYPPTRPKEVLTWYLISLKIIAKIFLYCTLLDH